MSTAQNVSAIVESLAPSTSTQPQSLPSSPRTSNIAPLPRPPRLGARPMPASSFNKSAFSTTVPSGQLRMSSPPLQPQRTSAAPNAPSNTTGVPKPNYNISLSDVMSTSSTTGTSPLRSDSTSNYNPVMFTNPPASPPVMAPPFMGSSMLTPMQPTKPVTTSKPLTKDDWGDFDPLK